MENENIVENIEVSDSPDIVQPGSSGNEIVNVEEIIEEFEQGFQNDLFGLEESVQEENLDSLSESEQYEGDSIIYEAIDYTETLVAIDEHVQLMSARVEYCSCLLIIILLIILLQYVYKFFKMFF